MCDVRVYQLRADIKCSGFDELKKVYNGLLEKAKEAEVEILDDGNAPYYEDMTEQYKAAGFDLKEKIVKEQSHVEWLKETLERDFPGFKNDTDVNGEDVVDYLANLIHPKIGPSEFIQWLATAFAEKRTDVTEICEQYLKDGRVPDPKNIERRYIWARIPGTDIEIEYDTLTTEVSYHKSGEQWEQCIEHEYYNHELGEDE